MLEKLEKLQKRGSIVKSDPINEEKLKVSRNKKKYEKADAGFVSDDNDDSE